MIKFALKPEVILTIVFTVISLWLFNTYGVKHVNDSHRYLNYATNLEQGFYFEEHNFWYIGYAFFILIVKQVHDRELAIIIAQNLVSLLAALSLFRASKILFNDTNGAFLAALAYLLFFEIPTWNFYILCESIYCSFVCFSLFFLAKIYAKQATNKTYILAFIEVLFTSQIKPPGVSLIGAILVVLLVNANRHIKNPLLYRTVILGSILIFVLLLNRMLATYLIIENYQLGEVVYAITTLPFRPEYDWLLVTPPDDIYLPSEDLAPLIRISSFVFHHPIYWTKLFLIKSFFFLIHVRPFWSAAHNIYSVLFLLPAYGFFIKALTQQGLRNPLTIFLCTYLILHWLSISITSVDWDGRFLMPVLSIIFLFSASAIANMEQVKNLSSKVALWSKKSTV